MKPIERLGRIIVVGGGYAGVLAANRLVGCVPGSTEVRLISPGRSFVNRIRLHETAARGTDARLSVRSLLHADVVHDDGKLVNLDAKASSLIIERASGREVLDYGQAILALGSTPSATFGQAEHDAVSTHGAAMRFHTRLSALPAGAHIVVIGGGLTAIELVTELAEARPDLRTTLIAHRLLPDAGLAARRSLLESFAALAVTVIEGQRAATRGGGVSLDDGRSLDADLCAVCDGFECAPVGRELGLPIARDGRIRVDSSLRVEGFANLFAVGDLAAPPSDCVGMGMHTTRMGCATAMPMGAHAADEVVRTLRGRPARAHHFAYAGRCISLGRRRGLVLLTDGDDRPSGRYLSGAMGALVKELICRYVIGMIRLESRWSGVYAWPRGRRPSARLEPPRPLLPR